MARACLGSPPIISSSFQHFRLSTAKFPAVNASHVSTTITTTTTMPHPHPSLEVAGGARERFLLPLMTILSKPYTPFPLVAYNRHLETIFAAFFRSIPQIRLRRECLRTADDGAVALDWVAGDDGRLPLETPVVILLPGLTGGSDDSYVRHMLVRARSKGWRVVVFNSRGCGDSPVTTPQFYSASFLGDMREVVAKVAARYPKANLYAIGWSLGANILVRYLGEESNACPLSGAVSLCNPFNLPIADEDFRKGFNIVYDKALANALCKIFKKHALLFEDMVGEYNIPSVANAKSVREFDEGLTRVSFGFKSVDDYYYNSSSSDSIKQVQIPLLCIQAANDPIAPSRGIPHEDIKENPNCLLVVTPKGGHLGWVAGSEAPRGAPWTDPLVMDFLEHLERGEPTAPASSSNLGGIQQHLEV
ncbi:embryogenesis-associated protein EMB8 [Tripterygium wilfordii]|uniref:Embryogenesis-associated protein EMB8 n=1 Tax=Tripterygium wilfordii TaxID=458696 RepID=A0A7J7CLK7_TRIWF|nr:embryogenesis-associated protein EMB8 isoform X2 [Tripterygium wilfordii]XP_038724750.1 embryogenesis-associated protein EMB8 isoform X2 [Tripterygium wilfordii]XP_038724751.1 embryogenesis-associated protein EMB8 isoform X2 [Tripterygium wilfordii]KAF5734953.1 embryogenesis-associated protein EMB8 [Tripterygium wilfordii]